MTEDEAWAKAMTERDEVRTKLQAASEVIDKCEKGLIEWTIYKSEHVEQALAAIKEWKEKDKP